MESWPWGSFLCTFSEFIKNVSIGVSVFTLTALSGDRYFAIVDPLRKFHTHGKLVSNVINLFSNNDSQCYKFKGGSQRATKITIGIAVTIWALAIMCGLPDLIGTELKVSIWLIYLNNNVILRHIIIFNTFCISIF